LITSLAALLLTAQTKAFDLAEITLSNPKGGPSRLKAMMQMRPLAGSKLSPKRFGNPPQQWEFPYVVSAYGTMPAAPSGSPPELRFRIYSQTRTGLDDPAVEVAKMLLRLWDFNVSQFGLDHGRAYSEGVIDVYLCAAGLPGGEQRFDVDNQRKRGRVNTIYIYDLASFNDPLERAREIAHEYGHAALPPIGGFQEPEDWANGYLGERLYLQWIRDELLAGRYGVADCMQATYDEINAYVKKNVDPIVERAAVDGPKTAISGVGKTAMDNFMGLALYVSSALRPRVLARSMLLNDPSRRWEFIESIELAAMEPESTAVQFPANLAGKSVWLPVGEGKLSGAQTLKKSGKWVQVKAQAGITITQTRR
jgi:hypothetical protein